MTLAIYTCGEHWVVASSPDDAVEVYCAYMGFTASVEQTPPEDDGRHPRDWVLVPDDEVIRIAEECPEHHVAGKPCPRGCDDKQVLHHAKTAAEWVLDNGRGYLAGINW